MGCGTGGNLKLLSTYGQVSAIELDDHGRALANKRKICEVKKGWLPSNIPFEKNFDLICMLDVLEHIDNDLLALKSLRKKLNQNGRLLITVPAYQFMWSQHDVVHHHKRRYLKKQLIETLKQSGYKILYTTYFNTFLFPVIAGTRFINTVCRSRENTDVYMPSKYINKLLVRIFSSEQVFIPKISLPFGVSILMLAENT